MALRDELTATRRERIWLSIVMPYLAGVSRRLHWTVLGIALATGVAIGAVIAVAGSSTTPTPIADTQTPAMANPNLDPGVRLSAVAPAFVLTDQFGKRVSLRSLRGKVVVLAFNDPKCTTICPLTTTALLHAQKLLGPAARQVELLEQDLIRRAVQDSGRTPYAVAQAAGVPQAVLSRFLRGERGVTLDTAEKLCRALGLDLRPAKE